MQRSKMRQMIQKICCVIFSHLSCVWYIEGLSIYPASDLTLQSFTLVCDLQGAVLTSPLTFSYDGTPGGGCGSPPNPRCVSSIGTIVPGSQTVNLTLHQNEIQRIGNASWVCTHGSSSPPLTTTVIALCMNGKVTYKDKKIAISCSCGFPSVQAEVEYKDIKNRKLPGNQTFELDPQINTQCTSDSRAMDFSYSIENFPSDTEEVCASLKTFTQASKPVPICVGLITPSSTSNSGLITTEKISFSSTPEIRNRTELIPLTSSSTSFETNSDMSTVSELPSTQDTSSSAELPLEIVISISSSLAAMGLILLIILVVKQRKQKSKETPAKNKGSCIRSKTDIFTCKVNWKSYIPKNFSEERNTKQEKTTSFNKVQHAQLDKPASKDRMYFGYKQHRFRQHYPQTYTVNCNDYGNQHVYYPYNDASNMMLHGNQLNIQPPSRPSKRMLYQSYYPEHPGKNEGMMQYLRADNLFRGKQMYERPYVSHSDQDIRNKPDIEKRWQGGTYEKNWDLLY